MATREFKTVKELFILQDSEKNWNFMRFLSEFHCWFDNANDEWNRHLFHDTIYDYWNAAFGNSNETLLWDAEVPAIKIADSNGLYWWPYKDNDDVYEWDAVTDESVDRVLSNFEKFLNHMVPVLTGTEKVTKHFGYEAAFFGVRRIKRGYYECVVSSLHDNPSSLPDYQLTSLYYQRLEQEIMEQPECYLWSHKRFRYARKLDS